MIDNFQQSNALKSTVVFYEYQGFSATLRPLGVASNSGARKNWITNQFLRFSNKKV